MSCSFELFPLPLRQKRARYKRSSLFCLSVSNGEKKFYDIVTRSTVVTTIHSTTEPLSEVYFPAVTVCNINQVKQRLHCQTVVANMPMTAAMVSHVLASLNVMTQIGFLYICVVSPKKAEASPVTGTEETIFAGIFAGIFTGVLQTFLEEYFQAFAGIFAGIFAGFFESILHAFLIETSPV
jgi:hypothetical protein